MSTPEKSVSSPESTHTPARTRTRTPEPEPTPTPTATGTGTGSDQSLGSETESEVSELMVMVGVGLKKKQQRHENERSDSDSDEEYNQHDSSSDEDDDSSNDNDDDGEDDGEGVAVAASYMVHEEYIPYGRKVDHSLDSADADYESESESDDDDDDSDGMDMDTGTDTDTQTEDGDAISSSSRMDQSDCVVVSSGKKSGTMNKLSKGSSEAVQVVVLDDDDDDDDNNDVDDDESSCAVAVAIVDDETEVTADDKGYDGNVEDYSSDSDHETAREGDQSELTESKADKKDVSRKSTGTTTTTTTTMIQTSTTSTGSIGFQRQISSSSNISQRSSVRRGKWTLGSRIGEGSFGVVHVGMNNLTGKLMAVKSMNIPSSSSSTSRQLMDDLRLEIDLMKSFEHPNIVRYIGCEMDKKKQVLHIFQEWVPGGSVASLLHKFGPFPLAVVRSYLHQVFVGLAYLHENHILHRDIKGGNILVNDEGIVKLADFGASKRMHVTANGTVVDVEDMMANMTMRGTPYFMAPEVFEENYGPKADVWSCGCVAHQMCTTDPPWKGLGIKSPMKLFLYITKHQGPPPMTSACTDDDDDDNVHGQVEPTMSESLSDILEQCFQRDPAKRPSAQTLLQHPFFTECDFDESSMEDESVRGGSIMGTRSVMSPLSPISPLKLADLKNKRKDGKKKKNDNDNCSTDEWPAWAKAAEEKSRDGKKANPFGK